MFPNLELFPNVLQPDTTEKETLSILHAMVQESMCVRQVTQSENGEDQTSNVTLEQVANLYMEREPGAARQVPWWTGSSFSHPTIQIGGQVLVEPSLSELKSTLAKFGIAQRFVS